MGLLSTNQQRWPTAEQTPAPSPDRNTTKGLERGTAFRMLPDHQAARTAWRRTEEKEFVSTEIRIRDSETQW